MNNKDCSCFPKPVKTKTWSLADNFLINTNTNNQTASKPAWRQYMMKPEGIAASFKHIKKIAKFMLKKSAQRKI